MEEKEKVLKQIDNINSSFLDIENFMPFNPIMSIIWGCIATIIYLGSAYIFSMGYFYYLLFLGGLIFGGVLIDAILMKKEMKKYNLINFSKIQNFIMHTSKIMALIAIILTFIFIKNNVAHYVYSTWVFFTGFSLFISSYVLNNNLMKKTGLVVLFVGFVMFVFMSIDGFESFYGYVKYISALFGGVSLMWIGIMMKKNAKYLRH